MLSGMAREPTGRTGREAPAAPTAGKANRADQLKLLAAGGLVVLAGLFAVLNFDEVAVNWILGTWSTPLIVVIVVSFLLGAAADRVLALRRRRR
jgi:uncharacterized integral membrane protein